jgi:hypothetical protein
MISGTLPIRKEKEDMNLLKEYITLLVKEAMDEDVNLKRLNPGMLGIYSLAQAINKLIYEGDALPGALPIDIISSGKELKSAPMITDTERNSGVSLQHTGSTFKLYIDPSKAGTFMSGDNETHDIMHTITGHLAKAIARRRESLEASGQYGGTPSKFNKITLKKDEIADFTDKFENAFGYKLPYSVFEKTFELKKPTEYSNWFVKTVWPKIKNKNVKIYGNTVNKNNFINIGYTIWKSVYGPGGVLPGIFGHRSWGNVDISNAKLDPADPDNFGAPTVGKGQPGKVAWKQSMEDEEMLGNVINMAISYEVEAGQPIDVKNVVFNIFSKYQQAPSPSTNVGNIKPQEYKLRYNTLEARKALTRLFELYNQMLQRYTVGLSTAQPARKQAAKAAENIYDREQVTPAQLNAARQSLAAKREPSPFPEPAPARRTRRAPAAPAHAPARPTKKAPARPTKKAQSNPAARSV